MIVPKFAVPEANEFRYLNDRVLILMMKLMLVSVRALSPIFSQNNYAL